MARTQQSSPRAGNRAPELHVDTSTQEYEHEGGVGINTADSPHNSSSKPSPRKSDCNIFTEDSSSALPSQIITNVYVVLKTHIVRSGSTAAIEPPAIRTQVLAVCLRATRAREIARRAWGQSFAYVVSGDKVREFDGLGFERMLGAGDVEVWYMRNEGFVDPEDGGLVLEGERRVGVWRVGVDCGEEVGEEVDGGKTPESE